MTKQQIDWREDFDKKFLDYIVNDESLPYVRIKDFISQTLISHLLSEKISKIK